jgi:hypothetical protein
MNNVKAIYRTRNILARTISEIVVQADPQRALASFYQLNLSVEFPAYILDQKTVIS